MSNSLQKEHTRLGDQLAQERRDLLGARGEGVAVDTDDGEKALGELFDGRSQLLVYHFMFGPSYQGQLPGQLVDRRHRQRCAPSPARS